MKMQFMIIWTKPSVNTQNTGKKEDPDKMDKQLSVLKHLVYILTGSAVESMEKLYEDTIKHAEELGISVQISGKLSFISILQSSGRQSNP